MNRSKQIAPINMRLLLSLLLMTLWQAALAESSTYDIEVLIFSQSLGSTEQAPGFPGTPDMSKAGPLERRGISILPASQLAGVRKRLEQSGAYQVLRHLSWRQELANGTVPQPFRVTYPEQGASGGRRLMGTIALGRSNYAILKADLLLQDNGQSYRLEETRRMKRNELHYLDHPRIGVIATLQPVN
ncbi:MAG: peptidoglycan binding protein CsiV [Gammaproteobacteria bacterium]|nr:peptidoglycan binding protein CsiV [Gammaproteobacteria bacterium]MBU1654222.1 peptidoglycan binding protein CsiV [Gammaproteobacteria bacterium]